MRRDTMLVASILLAGAGYQLGAIAESVPLVQIRAHDGVCVRVIEREQVVPDGCRHIDLENGRYDTEWVHDTDVETKAYAAEVEAGLRKSAAR